MSRLDRLFDKYADASGPKQADTAAKAESGYN
jgi:hypothetical protein